MFAALTVQVLSLSIERREDGGNIPALLKASIQVGVNSVWCG